MIKSVTIHCPREQIRQDVIAEFCTLSEKPLLSAYARVDSEWRDAIEKVTFRRLSLKEADSLFTEDEDLDQFERYVVGERRQHLQHIRLPVYVAGYGKVAKGHEGNNVRFEQTLFDCTISPLRRLFKCLKQWHGCTPEVGNLHVQIQFTGVNSLRQPKSLTSLECVFQGLTNLPTIPQIANFGISGWDYIDVRSMQALLSHVPNVRSAAVCVDMTHLAPRDRRESYQDYYGRQIQCQSTF